MGKEYCWRMGASTCGRADFPVCRFAGLSSPVFRKRATGKSPEPADWKVCPTLLPMPRHEAMVCTGEIEATLFCEQLAIDARIAQHHFKTLFENVVRDLPVFQITLLRKGHSVRQGPRVALTGDGAELVDDREPFLVGRDDGDEQFTGELVPEMVEKIF